MRATCADGRFFMSAGSNTPDLGRAAYSSIALSNRPDLLVDQRLPAPPRQARSRRARDGLLAAALSLFAETGYDATTVREVARRAGVAVGGFYLHFRSKRQVLLVLMDSLLLEFESRLDALGDTVPLPEQLLTSMHADSPHAGVYRAWREAALRDTAIAALDAEIEAWTSARIAAALRTVAVKTGVGPPVDVRSFAWMLSVLWWRHLGLDRESLAQSAAALVLSVLSEDRGLSGELRSVPAEDSP